MFFDDCEQELSFLFENGFKLSKRESNPQYNKLVYFNNNISIELYHEIYEFSLCLYAYSKGKKVDLCKMSNVIALTFNEVYQYHDEDSLYKGLFYFSDKLKVLLPMLTSENFEEKNMCSSRTTLSDYYTKIADQLYLSGDYKEAYKYYTREGVVLDKIQERRLNRIRSFL